MKKLFVIFTTLLCMVATMAAQELAVVAETPEQFGRTAILEGGRVKPMDTLARVALMRFGGKQSVKHEGKSISPSRWLWESKGLEQNSPAHNYAIFRVDHPQIKDLLKEQKKYYSIAELNESLGPLAMAAAGLPQDTAKYDSYQKELARLIQNIGYYYELIGGGAEISPGEIDKSTQTRVDFEYTFNNSNVLGWTQGLYLVGFLLLLASRLRPGRLSKLSGIILAVAIAAHFFGIGARMYIQERPPVTNLYSSALFVGAVGALLCLAWEKKLQNFLGLTLAAIIGFSTLQIADKLAESGDTLEMMRAVLDSNFWLATHVIVITLGYSAMFVAAGIAALAVIKEALGGLPNLKPTVDSVYATICLALLLSFVGTMLGGVWADQSWGRFWGWDPKENGALMIVLWSALILHARWGGIAGPWGILALALGGAIITAWSWFGTNMLGIGLHSYGFTNAAFWALAGFAGAILALIGGCVHFGLKSRGKKP